MSREMLLEIVVVLLVVVLVMLLLLQLQIVQKVAHGNSATLSLEMAAARFAGCKIRISHCHNTKCRFPIIHRILLPLFNSLCTHRLACGDAAGYWLYKNKDFRVFFNGIDTERFSFDIAKRNKVREQLGITVDQTVIGHVGAFNEVKNQSFLVDVLSSLLTVCPEYLVLFVGSGPLYETLKEKVASLQLQGNVIFVGETDCVAEYLNACDLIAMPSLYEGLPLSLIEEQANGLSCIVSDTVTNETDKTGNLIFLSLSEGANKWANVIRGIQRVTDRKRQNNSEIAVELIKQSGYDIYIGADNLRKYYFEIVEDKYEG